MRRGNGGKAHHCSPRWSAPLHGVLSVRVAAVSCSGAFSATKGALAIPVRNILSQPPPSRLPVPLDRVDGTVAWSQVAAEHSAD